MTLVELLFPQRKSQLWLNRTGLVTLTVYFALGALVAWFSWTQYARTHVFHMASYQPPTRLIVVGCALVALTMALALGPIGRRIPGESSASVTPRPWVLGVLGLCFAVVLELLVALAFGAKPDVPPLVSVAVALAVLLGALVLVPRWSTQPRWANPHRYSLVTGLIIGNMIAGYLGYLGAGAIDFWGKTVIDIVAALLLLRLGRHLPDDRFAAVRT